MNADLRIPSITLSIAAVERDTGLSKDTLRVWERRYGFPVPARDAVGERAYPLEQVERLRVVKRLLDAGHRPGRLVRLPLAELQRLAQATVDHPLRLAEVVLDAAGCSRLVGLLRSHDLPALRQEFARQLARLGVRGFVVDVVAPLNRAIGDAWMRGQLAIFEEHLYSEVVQSALRQALATIPPPGAGPAPRVLLTTLPGEPHQLGLLMAESMFAIEGCHCLPLGPQTPVIETVQAAVALRADIVALGFAGCLGVKQVLGHVAELRSKLPDEVAVWTGGNAAGLARHPVAGVRRLDSLAEIPDALREHLAATPA